MTYLKEEKLLLLECQTEKDFYLKYVQKFGVPSRPTRVSNLWKERKVIRDEYKPIVVPQGRSTVLACGGGGIVDAESIALTNISNKLSELVQLQKEQLDLFRFLKKNSDREEKNDSVANP